MKPWFFLTVAFLLTGIGSLVTVAQDQGGKMRSAPAIASVTPQSLSNSVNQLRVTFTDKMVNLSTPEQKADVFNLNCAPQVAGRARWNDDKTWVFDFSTKLDGNFLPGGTSCRLELKPGVKSLSGAAVTGQRNYAFQIDGPNVLRMRPRSWGDEDAVIEEDQIFILELDTTVDAKSVLKGSYFAVAGKSSGVPVRFIEGSQRREILRSEYGRVEGIKNPILLVQAREIFAPKSKVTFVWGPGITSDKGGMQRQLKATYSFKVRDSLRANFTCTRENANAQCSPLLPLIVEFSALIPVEKAKEIRLVAPDGTVRTPDFAREKERFVSRVVFKGPFSEMAKFKVELPAGIKDDAGRSLENDKMFPLEISTSRFPPLAKFPSDFGVIEATETPVMLPATLRNLEAKVLGQYAGVSVGGSMARITSENFPEVIAWMQKVSERSEYEDRKKSILGERKGKVKFDLPLQKGGNSFEVVGIPLPGAGFYVVELESRILGKSLLGEERTMYVPTSVLVTNLAVHLKWGNDSSLFWVTALDSGAPVGGASVQVRDCTGKALWQGTSDKDGIVRYKGSIMAIVNLSGCRKDDHYGSYRGGFYVTAQQGSDFTFTHSSWMNGLEGYRFGNLPTSSPAWSENTDQAHTVLARTLLRAGETVHMKHILRRPSSKGLRAIPADQLPRQVWIAHAGSDTKYMLPLKWDAQALVAETQYALPKEAKLGLYQVSLVKNEGKDWKDVQQTGSFRVEEFKVPLMKGLISLPKEQLIQPGEIEPQLTLAYQNGGPVSDAEVVFRHSVATSSYVATTDYEDFRFLTGKVEEGVRRSGEQSQENEDKVVTQKVKLSKAGAGSAKIKDLANLTRPQDVQMEMEFKDANGEIQTIGRTVKVWPSEYRLGMRAQHWVGEDRDIDFQVVVLNGQQQPVSGVSVDVSAFKVETFSHRKRLVGGFYAYESVSETTRVSSTAKCSGASDRRGLILCSMRAPTSGEVRVMATVVDGKGRRAYTNSSVWVRGKDDWWFEAEDNDRIDLIPERRRYEPSETARLQVRMPFRQATALVTFEREGVMDARVMRLSGQDPVIELPLANAYAPNVFVSTFLVRGRVKGEDSQRGRPGQEFLVDLNKPAFKMGATQLYVSWKAHELKVAVTPNKEIYQPREEGSVDVVVKDAVGKPVRGEFAIVVVDEGLLQLQNNNSWKLLEAMMGRRSWGVQTSTIQMQVVGKRHFGQKAVAHGGDGGSQLTRELFDTLLVWQGRVKLNEKGQAQVKFKLNDSLTKFRVAVVAQSGLSQFGYGEASVSSAQDLIAIAQQAPLARMGDKFDADITLRNTTKKSIEAKVCGNVTFTLMDGKSETRSLSCKQVTLAANQGQQVTLSQVEVPRGAMKAIYEYMVEGKGGQRDHLKVTQDIRPILVPRTQMAQLEQLGTTPTVVGVERPKNAEPNQGSVRVTLIDSLARGLKSVKEYFTYYLCPTFETRISQAIALNDAKLWSEIIKRLPDHLDEGGLVKYYPQAQHGTYELTTYLLAIAKDGGFEIPSAHLAAMKSALQALVEGRLRRELVGQFSERELLFRRVAAMAALARYKMVQGEWLSSLSLPITEQMPTPMLLDLLRVHAALGGSSPMRSAAAAWMSAVRARLTLVGSRLELAPEREQLWWMMSTRAGVQARLVTLILADQDLLKDWHADLVKLQMGLMHYLKRGAWDLPVTNAWAAVALRHFARAIEGGKVSGTTEIELSSSRKVLDWSSLPEGGVVDFLWPNEGFGRITVAHRGEGKPWAVISTIAAVPVRGENFVGLSVKKTVKPLQQAKSGEWRRGDVAEVTLTVKAQAPVARVALFDPLPSGAKILGAGLAGASPSNTGWVWPEYDEKSYEAYRAIYSYLSTQEFQIVYRIQLNASGTFNLPATRMEAMYTPETFAELANPNWVVKP